jgi:hypothetical protein
MSVGDPQEPAEEKAHFCLEQFKQRYLAMRPRYEKFLAQVIAQTRQADIDLYMRTYKSERDRLNNQSDKEYEAFWMAIAEQVTGPEPSSANDVNVEVRRSQYAPQSHPKREKHFSAARVADVAEVDNVAGLPAEPFAKAVSDFAFCRRVVAADEQLVVTGHARRRNP